MKKLASTFVALAAAITAHSAFAQAKPEDAIKYRRAAFTVMAKHFGHLGAMADGKAPFDAQAAAADADVLAVVSDLPFTAFGPGTNKGAIKTEAKPEIWQDPAKFKQAHEDMRAAMPKLIAAARSGSADQIKDAFGPTGKTCKGCHDSFKEKH
ncbi:MAG: cytochrome c [Burkholderiaceae bacterium]|jgi:cytochrome c556|nr:cytochrome c [Burkholderiaceae bacterium]